MFSQDILYNIKERKGIVYNKMFYKRYHKKSLVSAMENINLSGSNIEDNIIDHESSDLTDEEELEYKLFFRTCLIPRDKEILEIKLKKSVAMRERMLKKSKMEFFKMFPFYFVDSNLVG